MKKSAFLFSFLLILSPLLAQDFIVKKANTIIINNALSAQEMTKQITQLLFESGYGILNSDTNTGTITTTEKPFKNGSVKLNLLIKDNRILLRGDYKSDVFDNPAWSSISFIGQNGSMTKNAWDEMNKFALLIPGEKEYQIR